MTDVQREVFSLNVEAGKRLGAGEDPGVVWKYTADRLVVLLARVLVERDNARRVVLN